MASSLHRLRGPVSFRFPSVSRPTTPGISLKWPRLGRSRLLILAGAAFAIGIAGASLALGSVLRQQDERPTFRAPEGKRVSSRDLALTLSPGWARTNDPAQIPGMGSADKLTLVEDLSNTQLIAAQLPATSRSLLPANLVRLLQDPPGKPERVLLDGSLAAYYYAGLTLRDVPGTIDVYTAPTTEGVLTIACVGDSSPLQECATIADTVRLEGGQPVRLDSDTAFWLRLASEIRSVDTTRERSRQQLQSATTASQQGRATLAVSSAYERAAGVLSPLSRHSSLLRGIVAQLRANGARYRQISIDLQAQDDGALATDRELALAGETHLKSLLSEPR